MGVSHILWLMLYIIYNGCRPQYVAKRPAWWSSVLSIPINPCIKHFHPDDSGFPFHDLNPTCDSWVHHYTIKQIDSTWCRFNFKDNILEIPIKQNSQQDPVTELLIWEIKIWPQAHVPHNWNWSHNILYSHSWSCERLPPFFLHSKFGVKFVLRSFILV